MKAFVAAPFVFLIGYIGLIAEDGTRIGQESAAGHSVHKTGCGGWRACHARTGKSGVNWRRRARRGKEVQELSDFTDDSNDTYLWTYLRAGRERGDPRSCRETS
jgi:hypothetical protein